MGDHEKLLANLFTDILQFIQSTSGLNLRSYQEEVTSAVIKSVIQCLGLTFVVVFPRQSGKNELQAHIETYLLFIYSTIDAEMVKVSPTYKPQTLNAMRRLERVLDQNVTTTGIWKKESGYIYRLRHARIFFLSGGPTANVVGATANLLLSCDEAQDVQIAKWDKDFAPMAASTNATRVFWGTMWTSRTLLARELRAARIAEEEDGIKRVFIMTADDVREEVPRYGDYVDAQVLKLGRRHPLIKSQYFSEEIDAEGGMFDARRRAMMMGRHAMEQSPQPGGLYALLLDVAGEDESADDTEAVELRSPGRDSTALTVVRVDLDTLLDEMIKAPTYHVVNRYEWIGLKHSDLYVRIRALAEHWDARYLVVDSTGVGEGLYSFLDKALPNMVLPYKFSQKTKSDLGWGFLAVIETGRYKEYALTEANQHESPTKDYWLQVENCQHMVLDGPNKVMRWGVPDGYRDPATGELVHDDLLISAALCWALDGLEWGIAESEVIPAYDPLEDFDPVF
jgi:hypothetical protein